MLDKVEHLIRRCGATNELMKDIIQSKRAPLDDLIVEYVAFNEASQTALLNAAAFMSTTRGYLAYKTFFKAQDIVMSISWLGLNELNQQTPENHQMKEKLLHTSKSAYGLALWLERLYNDRQCEDDEPDESEKGLFNWLGKVFSMGKPATN